MATTEENHEFDALLEYLKRHRGFDFTGYKRASPMRRIQKRMQAVDVESFGSYTDYLEVHPEEFAHLFNTILINVTAFFRDTTSWDYLQREIVPTLVRAVPPEEPVRVWSAGCATGQEAYSLAMAFAEVMGLDQFKERVKIYATDLDEAALVHARMAVYSVRDVEDVPLPLLDKYFERSNGHYAFRKDLRRAMIFGRHDLMHDSPISRIHLLACRNSLMYFNAETQAKILARYHFALADAGVLFLGRAEMLLTHTNLFTPLELKHRLFTKVPKANLRDRLLVMAQSGNVEASQNLSNHVRIRESVFDSTPLAQIVIDSNGFLALVNESARRLFGLKASDVGRPFQDLDISYRPVELRSTIEQAYNERRTILLREVHWPTLGGEDRGIDINVAPLADTNGGFVGASVTFTDVTHYRRLQDELERSNQDLEASYEELQSTVEELETTNEELQSTVEELETTNEELQSTNEELETMNEELQSTNEELETINDEVRRRSAELNEVNAFLSSILMSLRGGVIVLDRELRVLVWNERAEDQWGLRPNEAQGTHFLNLDIGLPVEQLTSIIRKCLSVDSPPMDGLSENRASADRASADGASADGASADGASADGASADGASADGTSADGTSADWPSADRPSKSEFEEMRVEAINRRGKRILCRITCSPLTGFSEETRGVILLIEDSPVEEPATEVIVLV